VPPLGKSQVLNNERSTRVCLLEMPGANRKPQTPEEQRRALEDAEDAAAAAASREQMRRTGAQPRPWREVLIEMGLDPDKLGSDDQ
jgi:hypothetical protein